MYWEGNLHPLKVGVLLPCLRGESSAQSSSTRHYAETYRWIITDFIALIKLSEVKTYEERTSDQEWMHSMFAVSSGFSFGLVILENLVINSKIMG